MYKFILAATIFTVFFNNYCESKTIRPIVNFEPAIKDAIINALTECSKKETDVPELIQMMKDGSWKEDEEFKKYMFCVYQRSGYSNEDTGRVKIDQAASVYPDPSLMKKILTDCDKESTKNPVDPVETTFIVFKCYQTNAPYSVNLDMD